MAKKILVAYYSWSGTTKQMAQQLHQSVTNFDLHEIKVGKDVFDSDMNKTNDISEDQIKNNNYPKIDFPEPDFNQYDTILIGGPVWSGHPATPIYSFLRKLDGYQGKVVSFETDAGMPGNYMKVFKEWAQDLNVVGGGRSVQEVVALVKK